MAENIVQTPQEPDITQEELSKLKAEADTAKQELRNVVDELKEERKKRREVEEKSNPPKPTDEVSEKVKAILAEEKKKQADSNKGIAWAKFLDENKEFHPDNDPGGLKQAVLQRELNGLKTDEAILVDEFISLYEKAKRLIPSKESLPPETITPDASTPTTPTPPRVRVESKLSPKEQQTIKDLGWTEERYLKVKLAQPRFVEKLLST